MIFSQKTIINFYKIQNFIKKNKKILKYIKFIYFLRFSTFNLKSYLIARGSSYFFMGHKNFVILLQKKNLYIFLSKIIFRVGISTNIMKVHPSLCMILFEKKSWLHDPFKAQDPNSLFFS